MDAFVPLFVLFLPDFGDCDLEVELDESRRLLRLLVFEALDVFDAFDVFDRDLEGVRDLDRLFGDPPFLYSSIGPYPCIPSMCFKRRRSGSMCSYARCPAA